MNQSESVRRKEAVGRLEAVVGAIRGCERFLVQTHNNPDPDSIACAMAIRHLVRLHTGKDAVIAFGGVLGRSENRAMVQHLQVPMVPGALIDYGAYDFTAVCDTQPGTNFTSFPDGFVPTVVIDHHPMRPETKRAKVAIVEPRYGATSSIVAEMLLAGGVAIPPDLATALYYAIRAETQDLARDSGEIDVEVYRALEQIADRRAVSLIEAGRVPREYFAEVRAAIDGARSYGDVLVADLGKVRFPDIVAEMADFLLRLEGARWSCVLGEYRSTLYVSLRTGDPDANAGDLIRQVISGMGSGGGHPSMAGGQVPLTGFLPEEKAAARRTFVEEMLRRVGAEGATAEPLIPESEA
ncbi:MAG: DHH family phosphoesterase [Planctomycetes bacterium]|nr:DHH family phosphoesterase [Planctomycetota bacterium]